MARDDRPQGPTRTRPHSVRVPPPPLTARALVLGRDGALLPTLSALAHAVAAVRVPVVRTHGPVGPVTDDPVAGAAGTASAGQAHGTEPAHIWAPVWEGEAGDQTARGATPAPTLGRARDPWA